MWWIRSNVVGKSLFSPVPPDALFVQTFENLAAFTNKSYIREIFCFVQEAAITEEKKKKMGKQH